MNVSTELVRAISDTATASLAMAIWQGTLLAAAAAIGLKLLPKTPAGVRFAIWFTVFGAAALLPFAGFAHAGGTTAAHSAWLNLPEQWSVAIATVWLLASIWRAVTLGGAAVRVSVLWKRATPVDLPEAAVLTETGRKAQICVSDEVDRPSVIGFFAPKILIPSWLLEKLTPEEITHVVLHETGHLGRADDWLNLIQKIALVVFPLNPALIWIERRLCFERELACDERVLRATNAPKAYASCLAALAEHRMNRRSAALVMAALGRESELGQRVARILARGEQMRPWRARVVMGAAVLALTAGATGLERCPELVSFSGSTTESLTTPLHAASLEITEPEGLRAQPVIFHPSAVVKSHPATAVQAHLLVAHPAAKHGAMGADSVHMTASVAHIQPAARVVQTMVTTSAHSDDRMRWMVTEWRAPDGSMLVMTTFVPNIPGAAAAPQPIVQQNLRVEENEDSPVFSPYAAVPVRGGWIVVQL